MIAETDGILGLQASAVKTPEALLSPRLRRTAIAPTSRTSTREIGYFGVPGNVDRCDDVTDDLALALEA